MGAGDDDAGAGLAGLDVLEPSVIAARRAPAALAFDGIAKDFQLDSAGLFVAAHPVDAKVFLICRTAKRSIRSVPGLGQELSNIKYIDRTKIQAQVEDTFRRELEPLVAAREIKLLGVDVDISVRSRIMARPNYINLLTGRPRPEDFPFV